MIARWGLWEVPLPALASTSWLMMISVLLPVALGVLGSCFPPRRVWPVLLAGTSLMAVGVALLASVMMAGAQLVSFSLGSIPIALRLNGVAVLMLLVTQLIAVATALYTPGMLRQMAPLALGRWLWGLMGALVATLSLIWMAVDLLTLYFALELMGLCAVGMLLLSGKSDALVAGTRYLLLALVGSLAYLLGVALILGRWETLSLIALAEQHVSGPVAWIAAALMGAGLALKAALFPLHAWLAPVHVNAWTPVSALHAALVIKASLYILLMLWSLLLPASEAVPFMMAVLGTLAIVWGGLSAWRADSLKVLVASSTVAQLGYLMLVFPLLLAPDISAQAQQLAWEGYWLLLIGHALAKAAMFMAAGNLIFATGESTLKGLAGTSRRLPLSLLVFGLASVTLMGLPPSAGFIAKWQLLHAMILTTQWWMVVVLLMGTLLTAAYVFRLFRYSFIDSAPRHEFKRLSPEMDVIALFLALAALMLGLFAYWPLTLLEGGL
ncbi:proton-conducting transporter membrane subunit [Halomonas vilamensis]|uniref:Proton-conducting transporter membrane subunit n=1 Tax=Vreelandella vilamensis TaxID=531309 RepID=A0ABU1H1H0_9GAMM|nr:proton-conducting transporter membrane subunit [Halomonas vilamensis]MDR5897666.1 proton-conducting transporter membrane subunit [Halomonas vilamensis]